MKSLRARSVAFLRAKLSISLHFSRKRSADDRSHAERLQFYSRLCSATYRGPDAGRVERVLLSRAISGGKALLTESRVICSRAGSLSGVRLSTGRSDRSFNSRIDLTELVRVVSRRNI